MTVRENLIAARALIDTPEKWVADGVFERDGCYCAVGALEMANGKFTHCGLLVEECDALWMALPDEHKTGPEPSKGDIFIYNDDVATHADIMALFDRAIAAQGDEP